MLCRLDSFQATSVSVPYKSMCSHFRKKEDGSYSRVIYKLLCFVNVIDN